MKTKYIIIFFLLIVSLTLVFVIIKAMNSKAIPNLSGKIVMSNPDVSKNSGNGLLIYNLTTNSDTLIGKAKYKNVVGVQQDSYIVTNIRNDVFKVRFEKESEMTKLIEIDTGAFDISTTSNQSKISYIVNNGLLVFDVVNHNWITIDLPFINDSSNRLTGYDWSNDESTLLYSNGKDIYSFEMDTKQVVKLGSGEYPGFSPDNAFIFYSLDRNTLIVRELETGSEWSYKGNHLYPTFSPDSRSIAFQIQSKQFLSKGRDLIVWDYKAGVEQTIIHDIAIDSSSQFVWIE